MSKRIRWVGLAIPTLVAITGFLSRTTADVRVGDALDPNTVIRSVTVEIQVAPDGAELSEPLALDLGLGFPLWLHPLGREENDFAPFGASPQQTAGARSIPAGDSATWEFAASGDVEQDVLRTSPQLLAGTRISDISRIGFTGRGTNDWRMASYAIRVNGELLASNDAVDTGPRERNEAARERLTALTSEIAPLESEQSDLQALVTANLATDADRTRLAELQSMLASRVVERRRLERQLAGAFPWFAETDFRPRWRSDALVREAKVTVVTAPHSGADTRNYIYFQTGGHKYLLGGPAAPLTPDHGPQEFRLDLESAPLTAADLRGYALGMLGHPSAYGDAPDRWHPQRLIVEIDGRTVYDSEENQVDRDSLAAIRLVPPAQANIAGEIIQITPGPRETVVWEAGSAAGLDLVNGGPESLPPEGSEEYPQPEPGLTAIAGGGDITVGGPDVVVEGQNVVVDGAATEGWYDPSCGPFPGEQSFGSGWEPGFGGGFGFEMGWGMDWGWGPDWGPAWDPGWGPGWLPDPGLSLWDLLALALLDDLGLLPDEIIPDPVGEPPQLEEVTFDFASHTVNWTVTGDESQIDHFLVDLVRIRPDLDVPFVEVMGGPVTIAADQRSMDLMALGVLPAMLAGDEASRSYWALRVTLVPTDPAVGTDSGFAPAVPFSPMSPELDFHVHGALYSIPPDPFFHLLPVSFGGEPETPWRAVWVAGETDSHTGLVFAGLSPMQYHIVSRPEADGEQIRIQFRTDHLHEGAYRLIAFAGFRGAVEQPTSADVSAHLNLRSLLHPPSEGHVATFPVTVAADPMLPPTHLEPIVLDFNTAPVHAGPMEAQVEFRIDHHTVDPQHPLTLFGVRLLPQ